METQSAKAMTRWTAAECPFAIDYSTRVLDDIRLAVMDAFFSLPRGGAEIGGVLLGRRDAGGIQVTDALPIACEHAFGPGFVLSPRDLDKLAELVAAANKNPNSKVVGWYHSHTRSEIFLSEEDLEIYRRFFPEPWQVALVLKPHTFQPMRAGFFFRAEDASIHSSSALQEFVLEPLPMRPIPANGGPEPTPLFQHPRDVEPDGPVINVSSVAEPETRAAAADAAAPASAPSFLTAAAEPPRSRRWMVWAVAVLLGAALGAWGWHTRAEWLPSSRAADNGSAAEKLALTAIDRDGQLQIQWNGNSRAALAATGASLQIVDGDQANTVELGRPHVLSGSFTYARKTGKVDITLALAQPGGTEVREATFFSGEAPAARPAPAAQQPPPEREAPARGGPDAAALAAENARLRQENAAQLERNRRLEKAMEELRKVIQRDQQRKRLELQSPDTAK